MHICKKKKYTTDLVLGILRITMGWLFLWPFVDKLFGLGFSTEHGKGWLDGVSPTTGFLQFGTRGPFAPMFQSIAGQVWVDWLFMIGLLCIGVALVFGITMKLAVYTGSLLLFLMWLAVLPPEHNPIIDEHIVYMFALFTLLKYRSGDVLGVGTWWKGVSVVKKWTWLA